MWPFRICVQLVLLLSGQIVSGQKIKKKSATKKYIIPFQLTDYNNLSVRAILNEKDTVSLMFHTAANAITLTEESIKRLKNLRFAGTDSVKSWGGGDNTSRFSPRNSLRIGELQWTDKPIWENKNSGPETDGKFGIDLFEGQVINVDFDRQLITISDNLPAKSKDYERLKLTITNDNLLVEATCEVGSSTFSNTFLIHSGYSGAILFDDKFVTENKLDEKLQITSAKELKDSFGNVVNVKKATLPVLLIGKEKLSNVPVGFFQGAIGRQKLSIMGGDVLKRFNLIIDAKREYIYLRPSKLRAKEYANV